MAAVSVNKCFVRVAAAFAVHVAINVVSAVVRVANRLIPVVAVAILVATIPAAVAVEAPTVAEAMVAVIPAVEAPTVAEAMVAVIPAVEVRIPDADPLRTAYVYAWKVQFVVVSLIKSLLIIGRLLLFNFTFF